MQVIFVGEAPSREGEKLPDRVGAFDPRTRSGKRLANLLGVESVPESFACVNVYDRWPGRTAKGDDFPAGLARKNADALMRSLPNSATLILVGRRVASAFGLVDPTYFEWRDEYVTTDGPQTHGTRRRRRLAVIPHPSAVNRWWNDPRNAAAAARFLGRIGKEAS